MIPRQLLFHTRYHAAYRAVAVKIKLLTDFFQRVPSKKESRADLPLSQMTGSPKVNLFHCFGKLYVAFEKLIHD